MQEIKDEEEYQKLTYRQDSLGLNHGNFDFNKMYPDHEDIENIMQNTATPT